MRQYGTLVRRELGSFFVSTSGYIVLAVAAFLLGASFWFMLRQLRGVMMIMPLTELFYQTQLFWLLLLLGTPVITMRLFSAERLSGTFETLMTAPVSDLQVVLSKFTAGWIFYAASWLPLLGCVVVVRHLTSDPGAFDFGSVATTFLGILLLGAMFISAGCCASALTRNQAVAAIMSLMFGVTLFLLAFLAGRITDETTLSGRALACFDLIGQMHDFSRGVVDTRPVVFLVTVTLFFLFLTLRIVESRRWK